MAFWNRSEKRSTSLTFAQVVAALNSGVMVSEAQALSRSIAVMRAASVTAGAVGTLPLKVYRSTSSGRREVNSNLLTTPHRDLTAFEWKEMVALHILTWGNAYLAIEPNAAGVPVFLDPLDPSRVTPKKVPPTEANPQGKLFAVSLDDGKTEEYKSKTILQIPGMSYDGVKGLGPIGVARQGISAGIAAEKYALKLWESGALQSGILTTAADVTEDQAKALKQRWQDKVAGVDKAHEIAVLGGVEFKPTSIPPEDAQFMEAREFQSAEIYKLFGLNKDGVPDKAHDYLKFSLLPLLRRIESRVSRLLPKGQFAEFTVAGIERGDIGVRYPAYAVGVQNGWLGTDEVRDFENLPPRDDLQPLAPGTGTPNAQVQPNRED